MMSPEYMVSPELPVCPTRFPILYQDEWYVAIHKPAGVMVHRSSMPSPNRDIILPDLQAQLGKFVYPVHRLDSGTSGVLVLALSSEAAGKIAEQFHSRQVAKTYLAVCRGWFKPSEGRIDRPLSPMPGEPARPAQTCYRTLGTTELPFSIPPHQTSRYSLIEATPETGRRQQIRRHFSGVAHPIIGDGSHGDRNHNKLFREQFQCDRLMLMATRIVFHHHWLSRDLSIVCPLKPEMLSLIQRLFPSFP